MSQTAERRTINPSKTYPNKKFQSLLRVLLKRKTAKIISKSDEKFYWDRFTRIILIFYFNAKESNKEIKEVKKLCISFKSLRN
jgi:hypothetical protein